MANGSAASARIALCQFGGSLDVGRNLEVAERMVREAAEACSQLICLPEVANTVYMPFENDSRYLDQAEPLSGHSVRRMQKVAKDTGTMIVYPFFERDGDRYFNTAVVIGRDGGIEGSYR